MVSDRIFETVSANTSTFAIGFVTCASYRVRPETVLAVYSQAAEQVSRLADDMEFGFLNAGQPSTSEETLDATLADMTRQKPDVLILHYAGWTEDQTVLKIVEAFNCPVMLWATSDVFEKGVSLLVAHVGYMEACSYLKKMGKSFFRSYGGPDEESYAELRAFLKAARAIAELRGLRFGWIGRGYGSQGILDTAFDEKVVEQKLGLEFVRISLEEVFDRYKGTELTDDSAQLHRLQAMGLDSSLLPRDPGRDLRCVGDSLRFVLALQDIVEKYELRALSIRCFPEFRQNDVPSPCLAVSIMNQNDISASCEGDVLAGVSMYLLSRLSGTPATIMDVFSFNQADSTMDLFHCGSAGAALAEPQTLTYRTHCKPRNHRPGVTVEFQLRRGRVSFLKLDMLGKDCKIFLHQGESVAPSQTLRGNQATIRTDTPVKLLIEKLLDYGVSHHLVVSCGDITREAAYTAKLAGLELVRL